MARSIMRNGSFDNQRLRLRRDPLRGPFHRDSRVVIESIRLQLTDGRRVVIATDARRVLRREPRDDLVGLWSVADDVAELPDRVVRLESLEYCFERRQVAVDIRQHGDPHSTVTIAKRMRILGERGSARAVTLGRLTRVAGQASAGPS